MIEKMRFERKEKIKLYLFFGMVAILGIVLCVGYSWMLGVTTTSQTLIVRLLTLVSVILVLLAVGLIMDLAKEKMEKKLEIFRFNAKVDEFLEYLGNGEMKVKPKISLPNTSKHFKSEFIKNRNRTYYVRRKSSDVLYIWRNNKDGEEKWSIECSDYKFFFEYFEPIYD